MSSTWIRRALRRGTDQSLRIGVDAVRTLLPDQLPFPEVTAIPEGRMVELPGRGETFVVDIPGPRPDAPTVLLLHGLATGAYLTWFPSMEALARHYRVVAFDQRWHGRGIASDHFHLEDCADDAAVLLDVLGLPQATVVGYSMGGALAQVFWNRHPDRVRALVLCSTAMTWYGNRAERLFFATLAAANHWWTQHARARVREWREQLPPLAPVPRAPSMEVLRAWARAELRATSPWTLPVALAELASYDSSGWMPGVSVPTAVVVTARDRAIPTSRQRMLAETIPGAVVSEHPGGHTSLFFDSRRWLPTFLDAVHAVHADPLRNDEQGVSPHPGGSPTAIERSS